MQVNLFGYFSQEFEVIYRVKNFFQELLINLKEAKLSSYYSEVTKKYQKYQFNYFNEEIHH